MKVRHQSRIFLFTTMSFADHYLENNALMPAFLESPPSGKLKIVVMIPSCNEPDIIDTINSLAECTKPQCDVEVIVVLNESVNAPAHVREMNEQSAKQLTNWNADAPFSLHTIRPAPFPSKHAGVGWARKTGMDEAVRRFNMLNRPEGIIVSLDADTLVEKNYLIEIEKLFSVKKPPVGATIRFSHRIDELTDEWQKRGISLYEKYLNYYRDALEYCGYPHAIHTVGSALAVRADAYIKQGGMNRRQAGEDFYFLHKLTQLGPLAELNSTCVYPSGRVSDRVPFGTGAAMSKWVKGEDRISKTYNFRSFIDLKSFFELTGKLYEGAKLSECKITTPVRCFLNETTFEKTLDEILKNCSSFDAFNKRFFQKFNAFVIMRFQNISHANGDYEWQNLEEAIEDMGRLEWRILE